MNPRYARFLAVPVACAAFGSFSGCIATSSEMSYLRDDIAQLQMKLTEVQRNQADLSVKMDSMSGSMGALTAELQETQNSMSLMSQRLDDVEANITQRVAQMTGAPASAAPAPSDLYRAAYSDFSGGKFDLAITGFRTYLDKNPKGELAAQAQYYIGECYYSQNDWEKALPEFELV
jgi:TolA-binding protein